MGWLGLYVHEGFVIDNDTKTLPKSGEEGIQTNVQVPFLEEGGADARRAWAQMPTAREKERRVGVTNQCPGTVAGILLFTHLIHFSKPPCEVGVISPILLELKLKFGGSKLFS